MTKSRVLLVTVDIVEQMMLERLVKRGKSVGLDVASNPEFLREGAAIDDFMSSDRIVVGVNNERGKEYFTVLYAPFNCNQDRLIIMDPRSTELTKYAANAMLATKISYIN